MKKQLDQILGQIQQSKNSSDNLQKMTKGHYDQAIDFYDQFAQTFTKTIESDLKQMKKALNVQLARSIRKLELKLKGGYINSISNTIKTFNLQNYVSKEIQAVYKAITKLKQKCYEYINVFSNNLLSQNIQYSQKASLFNFTNNIRSLDDEWKSVTSKCPLKHAQLTVKGLSRPYTSWVALGVSKKKKQFGPINKSLGKQDFMGNIYLNGTNQLNGGYKMKRNLSDQDKFVVSCENRMVWVGRKQEVRKKNQIFIMDDNIDYYVYVAIRGPIQANFYGQ